MVWSKTIENCDILAMIRLFSSESDLSILHSAATMSEYGHYTYLCFQPFATFSAKGSQFLWYGTPLEVENPFLFLQERLNEYYFDSSPSLPPFQGGAIGYIGYEAGSYLECLPDVVDNIGLPDIHIHFYSTVIAIDAKTKQGFIIATGFPEKNDKKRLDQAKNDLEIIDALLKRSSQRTCDSQSTAYTSEKPGSNFNRSSYMSAVTKVKDYIIQGDLFEANVTQQFSAKLKEAFNPMDLYLNLINRNPAPFSAFLQIADKGHLISASPERFVKLHQRRVETCPIKGTRKRSRDTEEDSRLAQELVNDDKDRAENVMIVDLMRNDLSKVCQPGTIQVEELCRLKSFEKVHHLVSKITAQLRENKQSFDLIQATFPPGSITGAPKIRAMEIIAEIEQNARGPYCGCVGYWSFTGDMDTSVTIRTYFVNKEKLFFSAGGAVTLDSIAEAEYEESLVKARVFIEVLESHDCCD